MRKSTIAKVICGLMMVITVALPQIASQAVETTTTTTTTTIKAVVVKKKVFAPVISAAIMAKWAKVNICETGGNWHTKGNVYQGGLGILLTNWYAYGGYKLFGPEWSATPVQQVYIAMRIQALNGYAGYVPDQNGCGGGW